MAYTTAQVEAAIAQAAKRYGVPYQLALATANQESGLNPYSEGDYSNGQPTSFGLFQLHEGGELGNLTPQQAFNPTTNANTALSEFQSVMQANPGLVSTNPGEVAALAQRPADPSAYAASIDAALGHTIGGGTGTTGGGAPTKRKNQSPTGIGAVGQNIANIFPNIEHIPGAVASAPGKAASVAEGWIIPTVWRVVIVLFLAAVALVLIWHLVHTEMGVPGPEAVGAMA